MNFADLRPALAVVSATAALVAGQTAQALTLVQQRGPYTESRSVLVTTDGGVERSTFSNASAHETFRRFDPAVGVLQSARLVLDSQLTATGTVTGSTNTLVPQTTRGSGVGVATLAGAPGFPPPVALSHTISCSASIFGSCTATSPPASRPFDVTVNLQPLAMLARPGEQFFSVTHAFHNEADVTSAPNGPSSYRSVLTWEVNSLRLTYDYLLHAAPSFADDTSQMTLNLDFGSVLQGAPAAALGFGVFDNTADPLQSVPFRVINVEGSGHASVLTTDVPGVHNYVPGGSADFSAFLDTSQVGDFHATYEFDVQEFGAGAGHNQYRMFLNLSGQVLAPSVAAVPEPATWAMMIAGFGMAGAALRRRRRLRPG